MEYLEKKFKNKEDIYMVCNLHMDSRLDYTFRFSSQIFPIKKEDGTYGPACPIFFKYKK